jgi:hypothetical protein
MAFMLAVFSMSVTWYIPKQESSYSWQLFMLSILFCALVFLSGFIALLTNYLLGKNDADVPIVVSYAYQLVLLIGMLAPIFVLMIV